MKLSFVLSGCALAATVLMASQSAASEQLLVRVTSSTADASRFVVDGTGEGSTLVQAASVHVRTVDGGTVTDITTPAVFAVPANAAFSIRVRAVDGHPALTLTVSGSSERQADRTLFQGQEIVLARH